jgi:hypothetical protein
MADGILEGRDKGPVEGTWSGRVGGKDPHTSIMIVGP